MAERILLTGGDGFVGRHLRARLGERAVPVDVDVTDADEIARAVADVAPDAVVHLAAFASVASSWGSGSEVWRVNTLGTVNILDAVRVAAPRARTLVVSTGEVYGRAAKTPTPESAAAAPLSPVCRVESSRRGRVYASRACGRTRHRRCAIVLSHRSRTGRAVRDRLVESLGRAPRDVRRRDAASRRPFRSPRPDGCTGRVSRVLPAPRPGRPAWRLQRGLRGGRSRCATSSTSSVSMARCPVRVDVDDSRLRSADLPIVCGDASRLSAATGWRPEIPLGETLADALDEARATVAAAKMTTS